MIDLQIKDKKDCTGCYACSTLCPQNCILMKNDSEGFWYPKVNYANCTKCGICVKICPTINRVIVENEPIAYACINKNENIRLRSSSGGVFTLVAEEIIDNGGVVFGVGFDEKFNVVHSYVEKKENLDRFRGSKYVQSKIGDTYRQTKNFLDRGRDVLFTGTPCQISGLKSYLGKEYDNLFCMDNVCHGVPSPEVWKRYIFFRENKAGSSTQRIAFRLKNEGWKRYSVSFLFKNDTEYRETLKKDLFMRAFLRDVCLRPSCYDCKFKTLHRESDITLADFWGIQNLLPEMDDDKGTSLIFINSFKGQSMFEKIKGKLLYRKIDINQAVSYNSAAIKSVGYNPKRDRFMAEKDILSFDILVDKYCDVPLLAKVRLKVRGIIVKILIKTGLFTITKDMINRIKMKH